MTAIDPRAARLQRAQELHDHAVEQMARSALADAERVYNRHLKGQQPYTRYTYATARDNASLARRRYEYLNMPGEAARANVLYVELERLASLESTSDDYWPGR
jgi:hypothetical protein